MRRTVRVAQRAAVARVPAAAAVPARLLNVHEFQSQDIMRKFDVRVPVGGVARSADEAVKLFEKFGKEEGVVVKAQVLAGGRGLGYFDNGYQGGVHLCKNASQVRFAAQHMLGHRLITKQTGAAGRPVNHVLVAKRHDVKREMYFAILLDRSFGGPVMVGSARGGMAIEDLAVEEPDAIIKIPVSPTTGPTSDDLRHMAEKLGFTDPAQVADCQEQLDHIWKLFSQCDATMIEVNPLVEAGDGSVMAFDAKLNFDDNAEFRQPEIFKLADPAQQDPREVAAAKYDLNYIGLDGNIGCLVNGAGLAMATMDIIKLNGGEPANFLDVGGGATAEQVTQAVRILAEDPKVKTILVNIFGGIMRCDVIAQGLLAAVEKMSLRTPLVVRLQGTNVDEAKKLISDSKMRIMSCDDLDDAARKAVQVAAQNSQQGDLGVEFTLPL